MSELFTEETTSTTAAPASTPAEGAAQPVAIAVPDEVKGLIGEGKKYATIEAALASIAPAQNHISTLEQENAEFKAKLESNDKLDTILQKLNQPSEGAAPATTAPALNIGDIVNAVKNDLKQEATVATKTSNRASVKSKLTEKYGEKAPEEFAKASQRLGMSPEDLTTLAETSPQAALQLIGVETAAPVARTTTDILDGKPPVGSAPQPKTVMFGAKSSEILDAWRAAAPAQ